MLSRLLFGMTCFLSSTVRVDLPVGDGCPTFCRGKIHAEFWGWPLALQREGFFHPRPCVPVHDHHHSRRNRYATASSPVGYF